MFLCKNLFCIKLGECGEICLIPLWMSVLPLWSLSIRTRGIPVFLFLLHTISINNDSKYYTETGRFSTFVRFFSYPIVENSNIAIRSFSYDALAKRVKSNLQQKETTFYLLYDDLNSYAGMTASAFLPLANCVSPPSALRQ